MAEKDQQEVVVVVTDETATISKLDLSPTPPPPFAAADDDDHKQVEVPLQTEKSKPDNGEKITHFKEETSKLSDLPDSEKKALQEFKLLIQQALNNHQFTSLSPPPPPPQPQHNPSHQEDTKLEVGEAQQLNNEETKLETEAEAETETETKNTVSVVDDDGAKTLEAIQETIVAVSSLNNVQSETDITPSKPEPEPEKVSIYGIPLLADERSDVLLLKFLRARDFKPKDAFTMIHNTIRWRNEFGIEKLLHEEEEEEEGKNYELDNVAFMHGFDKEGHPVCYNVYGEFQNKQLYHNTFSDEQKRLRFLRWRIRFLETSIRKLDFSPGGISSIVQVNDLNNSPGLGKWELRQATKHALQLFQDNYPEFVAKQVFINVPWWYLAVNKMISPFLTNRTKSKFVFAGPSKSAETLLRYVTAEQLPVKYGGLGKDGEFETSDFVTEITVKPSAKHTVEFPVTQGGLVITWEVRVVGWEVRYGAEFIPSKEEGYTVIIQKPRKVTASEEEHPILSNSFKNGEAGKVVLSIHNLTSKNKMLLYRFNTKPSSP